MSNAKLSTALTKVVNQQALEAITSKLSHNVWAVPSRTSPNADKLVDGAVQRMSVSPNRYALHVKVNTDKVGFYKRPELNERASRSACTFANVWDSRWYREKTARIYYQQIKTVHHHPSNKILGHSWIIEFESFGAY